MENKHEETGLIYKVMPKIMSEILPIEKEGKNIQQNYKFRGIDQVYNYVQPILAKNGVFMRCEILDDKRSERPSKSGRILTFVQIRVRYYFVASDGSDIWTDAFGEGADTSDKAIAKAMSIAQKYAILQTFCIPTDEPKDPENDSHQLSGKPKSQSKTKKAPEEYQEESEYPEVDKTDSYRNITITLSDGKKKTMTKFDVWKCYEKVKDSIDADTYYGILGNAGYEHVNEIPDDKLPKVYEDLMEAYKYKKENKGAEDGEIPF